MKTLNFITEIDIKTLLINVGVLGLTTFADIEPFFKGTLYTLSIIYTAFKIGDWLTNKMKKRTCTFSEWFSNKFRKDKRKT